VPFPSPSAYDILDVSVNASLAEIDAAMARAVRGGRFTRQEVMQAYQDLRSERRRAEQDLFIVTALPPTADLAAALLAGASLERISPPPGLPITAALLSIAAEPNERVRFPPSAGELPEPPPLDLHALPALDVFEEAW
jgi:hypothetical protein